MVKVMGCFSGLPMMWEWEVQMLARTSVLLKVMLFFLSLKSIGLPLIAGPTV